MSKIKYIHCFGTSHTAGGGFEFNSNNPDRNALLETYYSIEGEEKSQFNFSYPGQLQKFVGTNIKVYNQAKQGYGEDRMRRVFSEIITQSDFNVEENLFIFEFSGLGRREYFINQLNEYLTINYQYGHDKNQPFANNPILNGTAFSYFYDTQEQYTYINENKEFYEQYVKTFINFDDEYKRNTFANEMFVDYLINNNYNFLYTVTPIFFKSGYTKTSNEIILGDNNYFKSSNNLLNFAWQNELIIKHETNGKYDDLHNSFKCNKLTAHIVYNRLISDGFINSDLVPINWKWYKEVDFIKEKVI